MNCPVCKVLLKEKNDGMMYSHWTCSKCHMTIILGAYTNTPSPRVKSKSIIKPKKIAKPMNPSRRDSY